MNIAKFPTTAVHGVTAWASYVVTWGAMLYKALFSAPLPHMELVYAVCALVAAYGGWSFLQFKAKRDSAWPEPVTTASEATQPATAGQPAKVDVVGALKDRYEGTPALATGEAGT